MAKFIFEVFDYDFGPCDVSVIWIISAKYSIFLLDVATLQELNLVGQFFDDRKGFANGL